MVHVKLGVFTPGESGTEADCFDSLEWARSLHAPTFSINPYQRYDSVYAGISPFFRLCASVFSKSSNIFFPPLPFFLFEIFQREFWHVVHVLLGSTREMLEQVVVLEGCVCCLEGY